LKNTRKEQSIKRLKPDLFTMEDKTPEQEEKNPEKEEKTPEQDEKIPERKRKTPEQKDKLSKLRIIPQYFSFSDAHQEESKAGRLRLTI